MFLPKWLRCFFLFGSFYLEASIYMEPEELPEGIQEFLSVLMVDRRGDGEYSSMTTHGFTSYIKGGGTYEVSQDEGLKELDSKVFFLEGVHYTDIEGEWLDKEALASDGANILGDSGKFVLNLKEVEIREAETTKENLDYYGAKLLKVGDKIHIDGYKDYPIASMTIEKNYVTGFLLKEKHGGGAYIEYHDNPHFHMPEDENAKGYLILGRFLTPSRVRLSAFMIPYGYAIYTKPYTLHADSFLEGNYKVSYHTSNHYSTVLMKDQDDKIIPVSISPLP